MPYAFCKRTISGLILAALAAGTWSMPVVGAQSSTGSPATAAHKASSGESTATSVSSGAKRPTKATGKSSNKNRRRGRKVKGQKAPTTDRISEIQDALAKKGTFVGTPTGKWDDSTVEAVKKFQASNGLNPSGKLDAPTLQKLGLGSQTAGLAAPTPPPNAANRLRSQASGSAESQSQAGPRE